MVRLLDSSDCSFLMMLFAVGIADLWVCMGAKALCTGGQSTRSLLHSLGEQVTIVALPPTHYGVLSLP
jgi:hypothetical protein